MTPTDPAEIGAAIRAERRKRSLSLERLARLAGVTKSTIINLEKGRFKREPYSLSKVAEALGVAPDDLGRPTRGVPSGEPARYSREWFVLYRARAELLDEPLRSRAIQLADDAERFLDRLPEFDPSKV